MPLDPQAQRYLDQLAALGAPPIWDVPVEEARRARRSRSVGTVEDRRIPGPGGPLPVRLYTPPGDGPFPVLVYWHGGGWVTGDLDSIDTLCRLLSVWGACAVVSVDYRLAPEHPFPAAVDDAYAATVWAAEHAGTFGGDPGRIAVGGDSAGGNLAAAVTLLARDRGRPQLSYQLLIYPVLDCDPDTATYTEYAETGLLTKAAMLWYWDQYVPNQADRRNPLAAPLRASDLSGLPPALVITAEYDVLRDEGEAYAARLRAADVPADLTRYHGMIHGFVSQAAVLDQGKMAIMECANALKAAFAPGRE
ncbi:MAG: alpha/beta hydrolase [Chloroflexi bacterium]|nr:alpha/beta hydrolase [Chloroflexota bacterium]